MYLHKESWFWLFLLPCLSHPPSSPQLLTMSSWDQFLYKLPLLKPLSQALLWRKPKQYGELLFIMRCRTFRNWVVTFLFVKIIFLSKWRKFYKHSSHSTIHFHWFILCDKLPLVIWSSLPLVVLVLLLLMFCFSPIDGSLKRIKMHFSWYLNLVIQVTFTSVHDYWRNHSLD